MLSKFSLFFAFLTAAIMIFTAVLSLLLPRYTTHTFSCYVLRPSKACYFPKRTLTEKLQPTTNSPIHHHRSDPLFSACINSYIGDSALKPTSCISYKLMLSKPQTTFCNITPPPLLSATHTASAATLLQTHTPILLHTDAAALFHTNKAASLHSDATALFPL